MKPVKLEILFKDNTQKGIEDTKKSIAGMTADFKVNIENQKSFIQDLKKHISSIEREISRVSDDAKKKQLIPSLLEAERELKSAESSLIDLDGQLGKSSQKEAQLRTQIMNLKNEMASMTEGTDEYHDAMQRLGTMQDRYGDITKQGSILADDERNIRATADAVAGLSGVMSAGVGIASLFGAEQEKLAEIQTRLQAVMATTIGLQQVAQTLNKDSYFSIVLLQGAKKKWAAAQALLNTQLKIGAVASKALMLSGIGLLIAGIAALVVVYDKWKKRQEEINALKKEFVEIETETAKAMVSEKVKMEQLHKIASDQRKTLELRNKAIARIKSIMPEYNGYIDKEGLLIDNANTAMKNYLVTLHKVEKAKQLISKIENIDTDIVESENAPVKGVSFFQKMIAAFGSANDKSGTLSYQGLIDDFKAKNENAKSQIVQDLKDKRGELDKELQGIISDTSLFESIFGDGKGGSGSSSTSASSSPENRLSEQRLSALRAIREQEISLMKEGEAKRKAQAENEYKTKLEEIAREKKEREKHIKELQNAKIPVSADEISIIDEQAQTQALNVKKQYDSQIHQIDIDSANQYKAIQNELRLNFETRLNQQLSDTDAYYNDLLLKAKGHEALVAQIEAARVLAKKKITHEAQLSEIELENELAMRKQEIDNSQVLLASDRQEKLLQIEIAGQRKRLAKLEEMQRDGMEVAEDIALVRSEIDKLSSSLEKLPSDKVREIGNHLKDWLNTLSGIGGELGAALSGIASGVDSVIASFDKEATTMDHVGTAIGGLVDLYKLASAQLEENRRKQEEWNDKIEEAVHKARLLRIEELEYSQSNIFGAENPYAKAIAGAKQYQQAMTELNASIVKIAGGQVQVGTKKVVSGSNIASGAGAGAGVGAAIGSIIPGVGTAIGAAIGGLLGGIFGATRKKIVPVFESLTKKFGSILKEGTETFELNPAILENYSKLDDATKKLVDNWEQIRDKALEAQEQMRKTFSDLAGDIGNSLSSALVNSFRNNDLYSAVDDFHDKLTSTIEDIISQLVFSVHFQKMFDELQQRMEGSFGDGGDGDIVDDIVWFSKNYKDAIEAYGKSMEEVREEMKRQGFDIFLPDKANRRSAAAKGIATASQDSVDENNARLTNMQMTLAKMENNQVELHLLVFRIFDPIKRIADNTDRLEAIENGIGSMREDISRIVRDGLTIKR